MADDVIISAPPAEAREDTPRSPFWDHAPTAAGRADQDVYVQFNQRRLTEWEKVELAGIQLPGVCDVRSGRVRKLDVLGAPGDDMEKNIDTGVEASEVTIRYTMWTPAHLAQHERLVEALAMQSGTRSNRTAVDVIHPGLNLYGITSLYVYAITLPEQGGVKGTRDVTIRASEYKPVKKSAKQDQKPIDTSLDALDKKQVAKELQPKTPSQTEAAP